MSAELQPNHKLSNVLLAPSSLVLRGERTVCKIIGPIHGLIEGSLHGLILLLTFIYRYGPTAIWHGVAAVNTPRPTEEELKTTERPASIPGPPTPPGARRRTFVSDSASETASMSSFDSGIQKTRSVLQQIEADARRLLNLKQSTAAVLPGEIVSFPVVGLLDEDYE